MAEVLQFPSVAMMGDPEESDAEARTAALDIRSSCIVEAPAGSGKTGLLVQRYLKLLGSEGVEQPEEVLAMTFTRKATAEMNERVLRELQAAKSGVLLHEAMDFALETRAFAEAVLRRDEARGWGLLAQPQRLNIRSILSICMELAKARPLLDCSAGPQEPIETAWPLYRQAARRTLLQLGGEDEVLSDALRTILLHRDGNLANCELLLAGMLRDREQWGDLVPLDRTLEETTLDAEVRPALERAMEAIVCSGLSRALDAIPARVLEDLNAFAARHAALPGYGDKASPIGICRDRETPPAAVAAHLEHWVALIGLVLKASDGQWRVSTAVSVLGFKPPKQELDWLKRLIAEMQSEPLRTALHGVLCLPPSRYPEEQWVVARALFVVLRRALVELHLIFGEGGVCDFSEFGLMARVALRAEDSEADVALSAGGKLRHLLVDEMQDTSTGQYELIELLTRSWDGYSQTLFLVGDPKQSIYLFRQARVERFLRTMRDARLGEVPLKSLYLRANFRSQARLLEDFNETFGGTDEQGPIFPPVGDSSLRGSDAVDVPFIRAVAARKRSQEKGIVWHPTVLGEQAVDSAQEFLEEDHAVLEAREIRRIVEERLRMPLPAGRTEPWSIAVLGRARSHLAAVVTELQGHQGRPAIPFRAVDLDALDELPEVLDALALTRALLHPADRVAWLAVLHAPWCGLGLADLLRLTGEGGDADARTTVAELVAARREFLSAEGQQLLARAWPVLETAMEGLGRTSLAIHVERTWRSLGGDAWLTQEQRIHVQRFLAVLQELESRGEPVDVVALRERLKELYAEPRGNGAQIDLLTMHKAKGLEWDLVLIPGLHRIPRKQSSDLLNWLELDGLWGGDEASIVLAPIWGKGEMSDKLNRWLKDVRSRRERAEEKRLFYVAATRAREELHLFGAVRRSAKSREMLPMSCSLLKACWPAAARHFEGVETSHSALEDRLRRALQEEEEADEGLAIAASAAAAAIAEERPPMMQRLPMGFDPRARFRQAAGRKLAYPAAEELRQGSAFERPEGSFGVRAFGNVVHRYLQVMAGRLATGMSTEALVAELPEWMGRLTVSLRGEGLAPMVAAREATRAFQALMRTMKDAVGRWILLPQKESASERELSVGMGSLRVDRTFFAGAEPLAGGDGCLWIVDFKTTEQGARADEEFEAAERAKYGAQMEAYAALRRQMPGGDRPIRVGLYYPLTPRLVWWEWKRL